MVTPQKPLVDVMRSSWKRWDNHFLNVLFYLLEILYMYPVCFDHTHHTLQLPLSPLHILVPTSSPSVVYVWKSVGPFTGTQAARRATPIIKTDTPHSSSHQLPRAPRLWAEPREPVPVRAELSNSRLTCSCAGLLQTTSATCFHE